MIRVNWLELFQYRGLWKVTNQTPLSPYYQDIRSGVTGILDIINVRNTTGTIKLEFIKDFLAQYGVVNEPKFAVEADLPENFPDPNQQS